MMLICACYNKCFFFFRNGQQNIPSGLGSIGSRPLNTIDSNRPTVQNRYQPFPNGRPATNGRPTNSGSRPTYPGGRPSTGFPSGFPSLGFPSGRPSVPGNYPAGRPSRPTPTPGITLPAPPPFPGSGNNALYPNRGRFPSFISSLTGGRHIYGIYPPKPSTNTNLNPLGTLTTVEPLPHPVCNDPVIQCTPSKFRTQDGSCNNVQHPFWGAARRSQVRLLPAEYADGKSFAV